MTILAVALLCVWVLTVIILDRSARTREREFARKEMAWAQERADLTNRIMYMASKPWDGPAVQAVDDDLPDPYEDFRFPHELVGVTEPELATD